MDPVKLTLITNHPIRLHNWALLEKKLSLAPLAVNESTFYSRLP